MTIRVRLAVLLLALTVICLSLMLLFHVREKKDLLLLAQAEQRNAEVLFDRVFELRSAPIALWIEDYTRWDEMVDFVADPDPDWAADNITEGLRTYDLSSVWVYRTDFTLVYEEIVGDPQGGVFGLGPTELRGIFGRAVVPRFFLARHGSLIEVRGAPVQPSFDARRETPARGYVLVARVWSRQDLQELADTTGITLQIDGAEAIAPAASGRAPGRAEVEFARPLPGAGAGPGPTIRGRYGSAVLAELARNSLVERAIIVAVPVLFLVGLWWALQRWVLEPLKVVTAALRHADDRGLAALAARKSELAEVGRLIQRATAQQRELEREIGERERTEEELRQAHGTLEERVRQRTAELTELNRSLEREIAVRQQAEAEARRARDEWAATFDTIPDLISIFDTRQQVMRMNRAAAGVLERSAFIDRPCLLCAPAGGEPAWECVLRRASGPHETHSGEVRQEALGRDFLVTVSPLLGADGALAGCVQVAHDITARKAAERALEVSEERLRLAVTAADLGLWDLDVRTGEAVVSDRYATMLGFDPAGFRETNAAWLERLHPDDQARVRATYLDYVEGRLDQYEVEFRQRRRSGEWIWLHSAGSAVAWDAAGKPVRMLGTHRDITARRRDEETLLSVLARMQEQEAIIRRSSVIAWKARNEAAWPIEYVSESIAAYGYSPDDFTTGRVPFSSFVHPDDMARIGEAAALCLSRGGSEYAVEYRVITAAGEVRWLADRTWVVRGDGGEVSHLQGVSMDISERRKTEEELRESECRFRELAAENAHLLDQARAQAAVRQLLLEEVNHRVKNNLLQIRRLIELESRRPAGAGDAARGGLADLAGRVDGLVAVHCLLSAAEWAEIPIGDLARSIVSCLVKSSAVQSRAEISFTGDALELLVPPEQAMALAMILNELTTNCIKYAFADGRNGLLRVDASLAGAPAAGGRPLVRLELADDGPGYPAEVLAGPNEGIGLHLVRSHARSPLGGVLELANDGGARATTIFRQALLKT